MEQLPTLLAHQQLRWLGSHGRHRISTSLTRRLALQRVAIADAALEPAVRLSLDSGHHSPGLLLLLLLWAWQLLPENCLQVVSQRLGWIPQSGPGGQLGLQGSDCLLWADQLYRW